MMSRAADVEPESDRKALPGSVLVIDDLAGNRAFLSSVLSRDGYRICCAEDGRTAIELVRAQNPDLVIMDVHMPEVDGFAACRALKSDPGTRLVPVVLITGFDDTESRLRGIDAGADDFLTKRGGFLHDIGKVGIPDAVLLKPGPLTPDEYRTMQQHTVIGDRVCAELRSLRAVRPIVRSHHERLDGTGYPDGLRGDAVPLLAQIAGIVDVFDALTFARPYRPAMPCAAAIEELRREANRGWRRRELVEAWITVQTETSL